MRCRNTIVLLIIGVLAGALAGTVLSLVHGAPFMRYLPYTILAGAGVCGVVAISYTWNQWSMPAFVCWPEMQWIVPALLLVSQVLAIVVRGQVGSDLALVFMMMPVALGLALFVARWRASRNDGQPCSSRSAGASVHRVGVRTELLGAPKSFLISGIALLFLAAWSGYAVFDTAYSGSCRQGPQIAIEIGPLYFSMLASYFLIKGTRLGYYLIWVIIIWRPLFLACLGYLRIESIELLVVFSLPYLLLVYLCRFRLSGLPSS